MSRRLITKCVVDCRVAGYERDNNDYSQHDRSAQYFHGVAAHADVVNALVIAGCSHIHLAWTTALDALPNQHLLISFCDSVLDHPTLAAQPAADPVAGSWPP